MRASLRALLVIIACYGFPAYSADSPWHNLLDKDFSQWDVYLSYPGDEIAGVLAGTAPESLEPIGFNKDEKGVFSIIDDNGTPVLRISGEIYGSSVTRQVFSNYHFRASFKWGDKKWEPRLTELKDSGLLYHSTGEFGLDYWKSWMQSQEFQVIEGGIGDYWTVAQVQMDIAAVKPSGSDLFGYKKSAPWLSFADNGEQFGASTNHCRRGEDVEIKGDWNQIELICYEDRCVHIANGKVVMALKNSRHVVNGEVEPLSEGKLQLQSEAAEVFYKGIEIRSIDAMPEKYEAYFSS